MPGTILLGTSSCPPFCPPPLMNFRGIRSDESTKQDRRSEIQAKRIKLEQPEMQEWWPGTGLNRRRRPFQGRALPLSYLASVQTLQLQFPARNPAVPECRRVHPRAVRCNSVKYINSELPGPNRRRFRIPLQIFMLLPHTGRRVRQSSRQYLSAKQGSL
jgi:hypothetical protein